jgi:hypothetical protein
VTVGRLLGCVLELLQRRLKYTLWREGVLVPEQSLSRLISCSIGMLPSWQVGQTHLHPLGDDHWQRSLSLHLGSNIMLSTFRHPGEQHAAKHGGTEQPQKQPQKQQQCRRAPRALHLLLGDYNNMY